MMWKLIGRPVLLARPPRGGPMPGRRGRCSKTSMIAPRWPSAAQRSSSAAAASGEWPGRKREDAQPIGGDRVELLDRPVVPRREAGVLQRRVVDREPDRERPVDHRRRRGRRGPCPRAAASGCRRGSRRPRCRPARSRSGSSRARCSRGMPTAAEHAVLAHPDRTRRRARRRAARARRRHATAATATARGGTAAQVQVIVAGVDAGRRVHSGPPAGAIVTDRISVDEWRPPRSPRWSTATPSCSTPATSRASSRCSPMRHGVPRQPARCCAPRRDPRRLRPHRALRRHAATRHLMSNLTSSSTRAPTRPRGAVTTRSSRVVDAANRSRPSSPGRCVDRYRRGSDGWRFADRLFIVDLPGNQARHVTERYGTPMRAAIFVEQRQDLSLEDVTAHHARAA